jgi:hypothetical protein
MLSETLVDWLKHAFITKFNHIRPSVYERYKDVLCRDLASGSRLGARKHSYVDQSPVVARRLGFSSLPLAVLTILIGTQAVSLLLSSASPSSTSFFHEHSAATTWGPSLSLPSSGGQLKVGKAYSLLVWTGNLLSTGQSGVSSASYFGCGTYLVAILPPMLSIDNRSQFRLDKGDYGCQPGELCYTPQSGDGSTRSCRRSQ